MILAKSQNSLGLQSTTDLLKMPSDKMRKQDRLGGEYENEDETKKEKERKWERVKI